MKKKPSISKQIERDSAAGAKFLKRKVAKRLHKVRPRKDAHGEM